MKSLTIGKFPYPPSSNNQNATLMLKGKPVRVPSAMFKKFKMSMADWHLKNDRKIIQARNMMLEFMARKNFIRLDTYFCVPKASVYYQNGNVRKRDVFNYLKAGHDEFMKMCGVDDSRIKAGYVEEMGIEGEFAFFFVVVSEHRFRMISEYLKGEIPK